MCWNGQGITTVLGLVVTQIRIKQGVHHTCGLAIYIKKGILRQKKNYGNSNISPW
jgi:hypothetical protein